MATGFWLLDNRNNVKQYGEQRRGGEKPSGTCVVHTAENVADQIGEDLGAEAVARYCLTRGDYGAYHRIVDADSIVPMAPWGYETWQCRITNMWSCGISAAVRAGDWKKYGDDYETRVLRNLARAGADFVRSMKRHWNIDVPIRHISGAEARAQKPGFVGHGETDPGRRSDPGDDFDWPRFLAMVREELNHPTSEMEEGFLMALPDDKQMAVYNRVNEIKRQQDRMEQQNAERHHASYLRERAMLSEISALSALAKGLAEDRGVDGDALVAAVKQAAGDAARETLTNLVLPLEGEITLTPKETDQ